MEHNLDKDIEKIADEFGLPTDTVEKKYWEMSDSYKESDYEANIRRTHTYFKLKRDMRKL